MRMYTNLMVIFGILAVIVYLTLPITVWALIPPDVIFSAGSTIIQSFSIAALVVASVFSSLVVIARKWLMLSPKKLIFTICGIALLTIVVIVLVYIIELHREKTHYQNEMDFLRSENSSLQDIAAASVPRKDYQVLLEQFRETGPSIDFYDTASTSIGREFYGDLILLYGEIEGQPFTMEIDFNRQETRSGLFKHYTFLDGSLNNQPFSAYELLHATTTELLPNKFIQIIERRYASDLSPRDIYSGSVIVADKELSFYIEDLSGDFITRNRASYMQYQSIGKARITYDGIESSVHAFVEGVISTDFTKHIFFPNRNALDAQTYQFLLWDTEGNFYAIDKSSVFSDTPQYPSHTWVLYKSADGTTEKRFDAKIERNKDENGVLTWQITIPLHDAKFSVGQKQLFKENENNRSRMIVEGSIVDKNGQREVGGILHLAE